MTQDNAVVATEGKPEKEEEGGVKLQSAESELLPGDEAGLYMPDIKFSIRLFYSLLHGLFDIFFIRTY